MKIHSFDPFIYFLIPRHNHNLCSLPWSHQFDPIPQDHHQTPSKNCPILIIPLNSIHTYKRTHKIQIYSNKESKDIQRMNKIVRRHRSKNGEPNSRGYVSSKYPCPMELLSSSMPYILFPSADSALAGGERRMSFCKPYII